MSVTANCSLVIKKVTVEDVGQYTCRQFRSERQQGEDSQVHLSVINMNEQKDVNWVTLRCSVSSHDQCRHTVKWLYEGKDVDKDNKDLQTSQTGCSTTVSFLTSHHIYTSRLNLFTCEVTDGHTRKVQLFPFSLQSSGDTQTPTTKPTTTPEHSTAGNKSRMNGRVVGGKDDDEDEAVTYSTVKASSSSAGASADLYATINKANK
ncbi:hypothetical protein L3Q82_011337 [Scortum barcoo]|uniref:Uncharacterized protein n=1 Tax=Scortum barcoo TaxID=214431 RepID=A0ACB8WA42_9TELE|nr:hypothetical protein L3Q82_011337 [Scortum barcoo]